MIRIAAVADLHFGEDSAGTYRPHLEELGERADVFLVAGDLTRLGEPAEAAVLAEELADMPVPTFAVLGNHDHHAGRAKEVAKVMESAGVRVLEGEAATANVNGFRVGVAGTKGFGGGFAGASGSEFGEEHMKAFVRHSAEEAAALESALKALEADVRVAVTHYSPVKETLVGEPPEIYPFLGSYLLGEAVDRGGADLALHGHAHRGSERGVTAGRTPVRNVAWPVLDRAYGLFEIDRRAAGIA